jgi:hypothetical protein
MARILNYATIPMLLLTATSHTHAFSVQGPLHLTRGHLPTAVNTATRFNLLMSTLDQDNSELPDFDSANYILETYPKVNASPRPLPKRKPTSHEHGFFSPIVLAAKDVLGDDELNKLRAKVISLHSDVISNFVKTSNSEVGNKVLKFLFDWTDKDHNGKVEADELAKTVRMLGFDWLQSTQINGILQRADSDGDGALSFEEWLQEMPKLLRTNLIKLAKKNGGAMGLLA